MAATNDSGFGSDVPFSEPSWYRAGFQSPYYNDSHRAFRAKVREFVDRELIPNVDDWEKAGAVPADLPIKLSVSVILVLKFI